MLFCFLSQCFETKGHQEIFCLNQVGCPKSYFWGCRNMLLKISKPPVQFKIKTVQSSPISNQAKNQINRNHKIWIEKTTVFLGQLWKNLKQWCHLSERNLAVLSNLSIGVISLPESKSNVQIFNNFGIYLGLM